MLTLDFDRLSNGAGRSLLDIGCGSGRHSFEALRRGYSVVAADLDAAVLKDVKAMGDAMIAENQTPAHASLACVNTSVLDLPFADGSFDTVIASEILEHIPDDVTAITELTRVTKPGGSLVITVPRWWPERVCWVLSREYHAAAGGHVRVYRKRELRDKLRGRDLSVVGTHHSHALHSVLWWLKCAFGFKNDSRVPAIYHRFLVWDIKRPHAWVARLERTLNPLMGKSIVFYARKPHD